MWSHFLRREIHGVFYQDAVRSEGLFDKLSRVIPPVSVPRELDLDFPKLKEGLQEILRTLPAEKPQTIAEESIICSTILPALK
ncbi:hypothetical protein BGZ65_008311, partial [Modicella reniformis]